MRRGAVSGSKRSGPASDGFCQMRAVEAGGSRRHERPSTNRNLVRVPPMSTTSTERSRGAVRVVAGVAAAAAGAAASLSRRGRSIGGGSVLVSSAAAIVGPHGGGFANILFAPYRALIVEVDNSGETCCYEAMSSALGLRHRRLRGNFTWDTEKIDVDPAPVLNAVSSELFA